jgi:1-acyl-sn-glycerol-3-phosphate acyltransferase
LVGGLLAVFSRQEVARRRSSRRAAEALPDGPIIVVSNHTSLADGLLLAIACRRLGRSLRLLATAGVFGAPLIGGLARRLGFIPVHRGTAQAADALDAAAEALSHGEAVGLYPEGRLTRDPRMWPERAKTGAVRLALRTDAPIVPVAMVGAHEVVGRRQIALTLLRNLWRRPEVRTRVGDPIDVREMMRIGPTTEPTADEVRLAADHLMGVIVDLVEELRDEQAPDPHGVPRADD